MGETLGSTVGTAPRFGYNGLMDKASVCAALGMGPVTDLMPSPRYLAGEFFKPFVLVIGGIALCLAVLYLIIGQNPTVPVGGFVAESVHALAPFAAFLFAVWLLYCVPYVLMGAPLSDLWMLTRAHGWFAGLLKRLCLSLPGVALTACVIAPSSLVRLYRPYLPARPAMGWRAGDSVQLE